MISRKSEDLIYLVACALNSAAPDRSVVESMDLAEVYRLSRAHSLAAAAYEALELAKIDDPSDVLKKWRESRDKAVRKSLLFDAELRALSSDFDSQGIWYVPLKGMILKDYYPRCGMREMSDNDILFDSTKREEVKNIFLAHGYEVEVFNRSNHDAYHKKPVLNFEMHAELFNSTAYPTLSKKYENVQELVIRGENDTCACRFSDEDYYVHVLIHAFKHFNYSGTGLRTLTDIFVLDRKLGGSIDRDYVERELASVDALDYEQKSRALAVKLFSEPKHGLDFSEAEIELLSYYVDCGTYGTVDSRVNNTLHKMGTGGNVSFGTKVRYLLGRAFPGREWFRKPYPKFYKYPVLIPFFWIWRIVFKYLIRLPKYTNEWNAVKNSK